jgi:hypothetical protein
MITGPMSGKYGEISIPTAALFSTGRLKKIERFRKGHCGTAGCDHYPEKWRSRLIEDL